MKTLDRYVLIAFLKNYLISLFVLVGLWVVLDMVFNFDEFAVSDRAGGAVSAGGIALAIGQYYFFQAFQVFNLLAGVIPVVAAAFTLMRMSRSNELSAVLAAGVPLLRVAMPIVVPAVLLSFLVIVNQELVVPTLIPQLTRDRGQTAGRAGKSFEVAPLSDANGRFLVSGTFEPPGVGAGAADVLDPTFVRFVSPWHPAEMVTADRAVWDAAARQWNLTAGLRVRKLTSGRTEPKTITTYPGDITPEQIALAHSGKFLDLLSTSKINQLLARPSGESVANLLRVKHERMARPVINVILVLLAIPAVLTRDPGQLRFAVSQFGLLVGSCMGLVFLTQLFATSNPLGPGWESIWPALVAWLPIFLYGPIAVILLDRVRS